MKYFTVALLLILVSIKLNAQGNKKFCQFILTNVNSKAKAIEIDAFVRSQNGVFISRADLNSKKYLLIYESKSSIDLKLIQQWMIDLKVEIKCIREGRYGIDEIIDQKLDCE